MTAEDIREASGRPHEVTQLPSATLGVLYEIAAQLAEMNELLRPVSTEAALRLARQP